MSKKAKKPKAKAKPRASKREASPAPVAPIAVAIPGQNPRSPYRPEMCDRVIALGAEGKSRAQIARDLGVHRDTVYEWIKVHPKFRAAMDQAAYLALAWWEDQGQAGIWAGKAFNASAWTVQMLNRFPGDYKARPTETVSKVEVNLTEVRRAVSSKLDRIAKSSRT